MRQQLSTVLGRLGANVDELADLPLPVYVIDSNGMLVWLNQVGIEIFGAHLPRPYEDLLPADYRPAAKEAFAKKMLGTQRASAYEVDVVDRNGHRRGAEIASVRLSDGNHAVGVFGVLGLAPKPHTRVLQGTNLTPRQLEVLRHLAAGCMTSEMATMMGISPETVRNHVRGLLRALGVHSRLEAVIEGRRRHLID